LLEACFWALDYDPRLPLQRQEQFDLLDGSQMYGSMALTIILAWLIVGALCP